MLRPAIAPLAALVILAACGAASVATQPSEPPAPVDASGQWQLTGGTLDDVALMLPPDSQITLVVEGAGVTGHSGCNTYFGQFTLVDGRATLSGLGGTEMACPEPAMSLESTYLRALGTVASARMDGSALVLTGPGVELRFERSA